MLWIYAIPICYYIETCDPTDPREGKVKYSEEAFPSVGECDTWANFGKEMLIAQRRWYIGDPWCEPKK